MVRKLKNFTMRRKGFALLNEDTSLPIHTRGEDVLTKQISKIPSKINLPKLPLKPAKKEQKEELASYGYNISDGMPLMIRSFDMTDEKYFDFLDEIETIKKFLKIAIHIDLKYKEDEDESEIWELLELKSDEDYFGLVEILREMEFKAEDLLEISATIDIIKSSNWMTYKDFKDALNG